MAVGKRIASVLRKARTGVFEGGATRALASATPAERLDSVCTEIGETVLPRRLTFCFPDGREVIVHASSRRLQRVELFVPVELGAAGDPTFPQRIEAELDDQLHRLGALFAAFVSNDGVLTVTTDEPAKTYAADAVGFTTQELSEAGRRLLGAEVDTPVEEPKSVARLAVVGGRDVAVAGPLRDGAAPPAPAATPARPPAPQKPAVAGPGGPARAFFAALRDQVTLAAIMSVSGEVADVAGVDPTGELLAHAAGLAGQLMRWHGLTEEAIARTQLLIMRANGIQNYSVAFLVDGEEIAAVVFANTDLSRITQAAGTVFGPGGAT